MAILQAIATLLFRQTGRLLNTLFGWATTLLFGKVREERQFYLSLMGLGSVVWLIVVLGIVFPRVGTILLAFVPLPEWVEENWIRLAMFVAAVLIPPLVGVVAVFLVDPEERPRGATAKAKAIGKGYPYTIGLALTLVMMLVVAPLIKLQDLMRRWKRSATSSGN